MKAYQVFSGEMDRYNNQTFQLVATYFDKAQSISECERLAAELAIAGDTIEFTGWWANGKSASWIAKGWVIVTVSEVREITII